MVGYGTFMSFMHLRNFLRTRNYLLNFCQHTSKNTLKDTESSVLSAKPKKPLSSFLLYVKYNKYKYMEEDPNITYKDMLQKASKSWLELDVAEKKSFQEQYNKNYEIYLEQLNEYKNSLTDTQKQMLEEEMKEYVLSKKKSSIKVKSAVLKKPKRPGNGYILYLATLRNEKGSDMSQKEWIKIAVEKWKKMSDTEKEPYVEKAKQLWIEYGDNLKKWEMEMIRLGHYDVVRPQILMEHNRK